MPPESSVVNCGIYLAYLESMGEDYLRSVGHPREAITLKSLSPDDSLQMVVAVLLPTTAGSETIF